MGEGRDNTVSISPSPPSESLTSVWIEDGGGNVRGLVHRRLEE